MRRVVVIAVAVVLALVGIALVLVYSSSADERAIADQQPTTVYIARDTIPSGTTLRDAERRRLLEETRVPAMSAPSGRLRGIDADNRSLLALSDIAPGEILLDRRFGDTPTGTRAIEVPPKHLAMSVELTDPARVGQFVTPGSRLTVYRSTKVVSLASGDRADKINDNDFRDTSVLLADVLVIGMGETALAAPQPSGTAEGDAAAATEPSFLVTLAVTPKEALLLAHAATGNQPNLSLYAGLRGADVNVDPSSGVDDLNWPGGQP